MTSEELTRKAEAVRRAVEQLTGIPLPRRAETPSGAELRKQASELAKWPRHKGDQLA